MNKYHVHSCPSHVKYGKFRSLKQKKRQRPVDFITSGLALKQSPGYDWRVCNNQRDFVIIGQYLFLFLIRENDSHLLKGYCCACYKKKKKKLSAEQLINWACLHCGTSAGADQPIIIIQGCLFFLHCQSWCTSRASGLTPQSLVKVMLGSQWHSGLQPDNVCSVFLSSSALIAERWSVCVWPDKNTGTFTEWLYWPLVYIYFRVKH